MSSTHDMILFSVHEHTLDRLFTAVIDVAVQFGVTEIFDLIHIGLPEVSLDDPLMFLAFRALLKQRAVHTNDGIRDVFAFPLAHRGAVN